MLATVVLSVLGFGLMLSLLFWVRNPAYRLGKDNVIALLELVLDGRATESDWRVFVSVPIRHDPALDAVRLQCEDIEEREYRVRQSGLLFTDQGLEELRDILDELRAGR